MRSIRDGLLEREVISYMYPGEHWKRVVANLSETRVKQIYDKYIAELLDLHQTRKEHT